MQKFFSETAAYVRKNRRHRAWLKVVSCLGCVVVFCTTYALILPAITLEGSGAAYCGLEEHVHTDECYTQELICGQEEAEGHVHTDECYGEPVLTCGLEEHTHTDECYVDPNAETAPAQAFTGEANGVTVTVSAPEGAFPGGTEMSVGKAAQEAVQAAADAVNADAANVQAVDITFTADGQEIEPALPISVKLESALVAAAEDAVVIHVDDAAQAEVISDATVEDEAITFEADAFSVYAIVGTDATPRATYNFVDEDGKTIETQIVKSGEKLVEPANQPTSSNSEEFLGWYDTDGNKFDFSQAVSVTENTTVTLKARFAGIYYVTFYDANNTTVKTVKKVTLGDNTSQTVTIDDVTVEPTVQGKAFDGWAYAISGTKIAENSITVSGDTSLYPVFTDAHWLIFNSGATDATATPTQYIKSGETTVEPEAPKRPGYTFDGWYTNENGGTQFDFGSALTTDTTVYAHWTAATANYTIIIWRQKVTDAKDAADNAKTYDYAESIPLTAQTGTQVSVPNVYTQYTTEDYLGFEYARCDSAKEVAADGSTILNVYYDRKLVTFNFTSGNNTQSYTGLYGSSLASNDYTWPEGLWQFTEDDEETTTTMSYLGEFVRPNGVSSYTVNFSKQDKTANITYSFYLQDLNGNYSNVASDTGYGYRENNNTFNFTLANKYTGFKVVQYRRYTTNNSGKKTYENNGNWQSGAAGNSIAMQSGNGYNTTYYKGMEIRYERLSYQFDFYNGNGKDPYQSETVLYEASLADLETKYTPTYPGYAEDAAYYTFDGWYADPQFTVKYDFNQTMPAANVAVYAKWVPKQLTVNYDANGGTVENSSETVNYKENATGQTPTWAGHTFLGWYVADADGEASETLWSFESPVTSDMTLIAKWRSDTALTVEYNLNGGTATDKIVDTNEYADGATAKVTSGIPTLEGRRFIGWQLDDKIYYAGDVVEVSTDNDRADGTSDGKVTLTAVFDELPSTSITFDANSGTFEANTTTYIKSLANNEGVDLDTITPTREGYKLIGWATSADGPVVYKADGTTTEEIAVDNINKDSNILYAVWEKVLDLTIKKVDSEDATTVLEDAEFTFTRTVGETTEYYSTDGWTDTVSTLTTDENGTIILRQIEDGTYTLTEVKAPDGYNLLTDSIPVSVSGGKVTSAAITGSDKVTHTDDTITVKNNHGYELPHTGGAGTYFYTYSGLLLMAGAVVYGYTLRRKRERRTVE